MDTLIKNNETDFLAGIFYFDVVRTYMSHRTYMSQFASVIRRSILNAIL